jgi:hypothetical protein
LWGLRLRRRRGHLLKGNRVGQERAKVPPADALSDVGTFGPGNGNSKIAEQEYENEMKMENENTQYNYELETKTAMRNNNGNQTKQ